MSNYPEILKRSRKLRKKQTWEEAIVWEMVRNRRLLNLKFTRQLPIIYNKIKRLNYYIVDFYCHEKKLVLEIDGKIHDFQKEYDRERDSIINEMGIKVVRIKNDETKDKEELKSKLIVIVRSV
jgi:very-short-patch-repair endonuclease